MSTTKIFKRVPAQVLFAAISSLILGACVGDADPIGASTGSAGASVTSGGATGTSGGSSTTSGSSGSSKPSTTTAVQIVSPAFYVSPSGSDSNSGASPSEAFQTLEKAQAAMRASSTKTAYLMSGTYMRSAAIDLQPSDANEAWLGYPGQTPVLNGKSTTNYAFGIHTTGITVRGITIKSFATIGILAQYASNVTIDSNHVADIYSNAWSQGAIVLGNSISNATVTHNFIDNINYGGVVAVNVVGDTLENVLIENNSISNTCLSVADCGAIYADNRGHNASNIVIHNNVISHYGTTSNESKGIYLDDEISHVSVTNNIISGTGMFGLQIHGGDHNVFRNNVFDISGATQLALYEYDGDTYPNYGMSGNEFTCNIVYSSASPPYELWHTTLVAQDTLPNVNGNIYWDTRASLPNIGVVDTAPIIQNPDFINANQANYGFAASPPSSCGFSPIDTSQVGPVAGS
jgi:hypothetical protein